MSCERLPPELIDGIFDHLRQDSRALKVCSLVCKAWLYSAYRLLFCDVGLSLHKLATLYHPNSIAAPFVRNLFIRRSSTHEWNETFPSLDGFHSVTLLSLDTLPWDEILPEIRSTISNRFVTITRLELHEVVTTAFSDLVEIICTFRCLESLLLGSTVWRTSNKASSSLRLPQYLHALELDDSNLIQILKWFRSFGRDLTLRNVSFRNVKEPDCQSVNAFLQVLGPSLETFRIELLAVKCHVFLHHNTRLRILHLHVRRGCESQIGFTPLLLGVKSVHMEEIILNLVTYVDYFDLGFYHQIEREWGDVDGILERQEFSNLKSVRVRHSAYDSGKPERLEWFFLQLPLCRKRGILRLYETVTYGPYI